MSSQSILVLKFGGSVLTDESSFPAVVHEIARWCREGFGVVAVCSALAGETARRSASCPVSFGPHERANYLAEGERNSARELGRALERAGLDARVKTPMDLALRASGLPEESTPISVNIDRLCADLEEASVLVVPGFFAHDEQGRVVLLGTGGSDSTALFLAEALGGVRCRLLKDVPALFECDPKGPGPVPLRYERANYEDALATDGSIVQHRAVEFARDRRLRFEIAELQGITCTEVGERPSMSSPLPPSPGPLRVALLGLGTVGGGVAERLLADPARFELTRVLVREPERPRDVDVPAGRLTCDPARALEGEPDLVIELLGGLEPAGSLVDCALERGLSVVTGNKLLLARDGQALRATARRRGAQILASAAVGGAVPVLEQLARLGPSRVRGLRGVLNGTANFVLTSLSEGHSWERSIERAQQLGLAEADPTRDLLGLDALDKLHVLAQALCWAIPESHEPALELPVLGTKRLHQVARLDPSGASVQFEALPPDCLLYTSPSPRDS